jgi:hypothetical protein
MNFQSSSVLRKMHNLLLAKYYVPMRRYELGTVNLIMYIYVNWNCC